MNILCRRLNSSIFCKHLQLRQLSKNVAIKEKKIGMIGMGMVGNAVIKNLQRNGYKVTHICDIDESKLSEFSDSCKISPNPRSVVSEVDLFITALPKPINIKTVFEGPDGILAGLSRDQIWVDHSTTDYEQTQTFSVLTEDKGAHMLESPVTGGLEALKKGQMSTLVAGNKEVFEYLKPMLETSFQSILFTGPLGTALIPKAISNVFAAMGCIAASEALMICKRAGIDMKVVFDAIRTSSGNSFAWETAVPMIFQGTYDPSFSLDLHCKDNQLVFDMAKRFGVPIELMGHIQQIYNRALSKYGPDAPCYIPAKLIENACHESLRCDDFKNWSYSIENVDGSGIIRHEGIDVVRTGHPLPK